MTTTGPVPPPISDHPLVDALAKATIGYRAAMDQAAEHLKKRNAAIVALSRSNSAPRSQMARVSGLTSGRIQQVLDAAGGAEPDDGADEWTDELRYEVSKAAAKTQQPSVGIGVRRESREGIRGHVGEGYGGQWPLTGDLEADRSAVLDALEQLVRLTQEGKLDHLLNVEPAE